MDFNPESALQSKKHCKLEWQLVERNEGVQMK